MTRLRQLMMDARRELGSVFCPACGTFMTSPSILPGKQRQQPHCRTRGHLRPSKDRPDFHKSAWVHMCRSCNADQGAHRLVDWLVHLTKEGDPRAAAVAELVRVLQAHGAPL